LVAAALWVGRSLWMPAIAAPLTTEDTIVPVDVIVVSNAFARADTLEAADCFSAGVSRHIVLPFWQGDAVDREVQALGVPWLSPTELATAILLKSGVPADAIEVLKEPVDGLNAEVASVGRFLRERRPRSILFITARSHTRRARWLLARVAPAETTVRVYAARRDRFRPETWWHSRDSGREVAMEYLRWINTFVLQDPWGTNVAAVAEQPR
jgi:uncharacterized SAM-binding protein YcdF (DUF218 family)